MPSAVVRAAVWLACKNIIFVKPHPHAFDMRQRGLVQPHTTGRTVKAAGGSAAEDLPPQSVVALSGGVDSNSRKVRFCH